MLFQMRHISDCTMDYSFEVSALDGSFLEEQAVSSVYCVQVQRMSLQIELQTKLK